MIASSITRRLALISSAYVTLIAGPRLHAQSAGLPEPVRAALDRYADLDPLAVTYSQTTEAAEMGKQKIAKKILDSMITSHTNIQNIALRQSRIYMRRESKALRTFELAFDGSVLYMGSPAMVSTKSKERPMLHKLLPKNDHPEASYISLPYFQGAGIRLPTRLRELVLPWRPQSELVALLAEGGRVEATGPATLEGRSLVMVKMTAQDWTLQGIKADLAKTENQLRLRSGITEEEVQRQLSVARKLQERRAPLRRHEFILDPECAYAVRRLEIRDEAGRLVTRSECTDHEQLTGRHVWMPRRCRVEQYSFGELRDEDTMIPLIFGSPLYTSEFKVSDFDLQPWPDDRFALNYTTPGTHVNDATLPGVKGSTGVVYTIPADRHQLDQVIEIAKKKSQGIGKDGKQFRTLKILFLVVNVVLGFALAAYFVARRRKARRA